jgi:D-serine deaminase-like pyridoxal phosphate-dependent protein
LSRAGLQCPVVATGSTPSCSQPGEHMTSLDEFHPGNYVFYDYQQHLLGSCELSEIAGRVLTRVIGHYPERNVVLVDCGFTALSHDGIGKTQDGRIAYVEDFPNLNFYKMSQEVGYVTSDNGPLDFSKHPVGSILYLLPYHACATACMHPEYYVHQGNKIIDRWIPCRGW